MEASHDTVIRAQAQLQKCALRLAEMAERVADAKQIKEYDGDRRKRALADVVAGLLANGESAAAAEFKARASRAYGEALGELAMQYQTALRVIEQADAQRILWESARSLLSVERAKIGLL